MLVNNIDRVKERNGKRRVEDEEEEEKVGL